MSESPIEGNLNIIKPEVFSFSKEIVSLVNDTISGFNLEEIKTNSSLYGAKGANLIELQKQLEKIKRILNIPNIIIPKFECIPVFIYEKWLLGENIDNLIYPYFERFNKKPYILRSSAVYSEDGDDITGAGIYDSIPVEEKYDDFEIFKKTLVNVFLSVESEQALKYRIDNEIWQEEKMGIIIQEFITDDAMKGQIDSIGANIPELMKLSLGESALYLKRDQLAKSPKNKIESFEYLKNEVIHGNFDLKQIDINTIRTFSLICLLIELLYGKPIQLEIGFKDDFFSYKNEILYYLFQTRPLPKNYQK